LAASLPRLGLIRAFLTHAYRRRDVCLARTILTHVKTHEHNEGIVALLQQLVAQNAELARELAAVKAKLELLEHKIDTIAEEAGWI
jgi:hypothetical protein